MNGASKKVVTDTANALNNTQSNTKFVPRMLPYIIVQTGTTIATIIMRIPEAWCLIGLMAMIGSVGIYLL